MAMYYVEVMVEYAGEVEADTPEEAEQKAWDGFGDEIPYAGVYSINVEELDSDEDEEDNA